VLVLLRTVIYEVHHGDGLRCHDTRAKFHKDWFRHSEIAEGDTHTDTDSNVIS
jgi:hypothetical protein